MVFAVFCSVFLHAQTTPVKKPANKTNPVATQAKPATTTAVNNPPTARNMADYRKTPQGIARAKKHAKATANNLSSHIRYSDGTGATITMVKNPAGDNNVNTKIMSKSPNKDSTDKSTGAQWNCSSQTIELDANSPTFLNNDYSAAVSHLYPGAVFLFENFIKGNYVEQTGMRNDLTITTDNPNIKGPGYLTVADPNMATVHAAIAKLFSESTGPAATESNAFQIIQNYNSAASSLGIYGFASYAGASASDQYDNSSNSKTVSITLDIRKSVFTISTIPPDSGFFKNPTLEDDASLMVIGNVNYGMRILANVTMTFNSSSEADNFKAAYSGYGVEANVAINYITNSKSASTTINGYVVGGPGSSTISWNLKDLQANITKLVGGLNYQNARPISYQMYDMAGDLVGAQSATDEFTERSCTPASLDGAVLQSSFATIGTGSDDKHSDSPFFLYVGVGNNVTPSLTYRDANQGDEYPVNTTRTIEMLTTYTNTVTGKEAHSPKTTMGDFTENNKGGYITIGMKPLSPPDNWNIQGLTITLNFAGGIPEPITIPAFQLMNTQGQTFYFDGSFKLIGSPQTQK